jgi:hypothetical protein
MKNRRILAQIPAVRRAEAGFVDKALRLRFMNFAKDPAMAALSRREETVDRMEINRA